MSIIKTSQVFSGYAMTYKFEIVEKKDLTVQLEVSKSSFINLFGDILNETRGFKYQITVKVLLKKLDFVKEIGFARLYFNSLKKAVINNRFRLKKSFQEILYMIDA